MAHSDSTRWTIIRRAAEGDDSARETFAKQYLPVIRAYLGSRWRDAKLADDVEDAAQEVFVECFRQSGALERVDPDRGGFRGFLFGVTRNVARRFERRGTNRAATEVQPVSEAMAQVRADDDGPSQAFDRAWAMALVRQAGAVMREQARQKDAGAERRVELLRLRIVEGLPVREIAARWDEDPQQVHRAYARARREFLEALREVVAGLEGGTAEQIDAECERLLTYFG